MENKLGKYIFIGDSLTRGYGVPSGHGWVELLAQNPFFADKKVENHGVDGDTLQGILNRLERLTISDQDLVFVMGGTNDILMGRNADYCISKLKSIVNHIQISGAHLVIGLPPHIEFDPFDQNDVIVAYNDRIKELARKEEIPLIDFYSPLKAASEANQVVYEGDVHPNEAGYEIMYTCALEAYKIPV